MERGARMPDAATNSSLQFNSIQPGMEVVRLRAWLNHSSCFSGSVESNRKSERCGMECKQWPSPLVPLVTPTLTGSPWIPSCSRLLLTHSLTRSSCVVRLCECDRRARSSYRHKPTEPEERKWVAQDHTHARKRIQCTQSVGKKQENLG